MAEAVATNKQKEQTKPTLERGGGRNLLRQDRRRQRAALLYPLLRRADISFTRTIPASDEPFGQCAPEIDQAVRDVIGAGTPVTRR